VIDRIVRERLDNGVPLRSGALPGAVVLVARRGVVEHLDAYGYAVRYVNAAGTADASVPMTADTIFDLASITKLFTAAVTLQAAEDGLLDLDAPAAEHLPELHRGITVRHLLTHTSGLPAVRRLWTVSGGHRERATALLASPTEAPPGVRYEYSCVGYLVTGLLLERVLGTPLPQLVADRITGPLGMADTGYRPDAATVHRVAATEDSAHVGRGVLRGEVHDEASWSLGGTGGNAGLFGTAADLLRFAEALRCGGADPRTGARILSEPAVALMTSDQLGPAQRRAVGYGQGVGPRIADRTFMGFKVSDRAFGHSGFTGTSVVLDPAHELVVIVLANAVHPVRGRTEMGPIRSAITDAALSGAVRRPVPARGAGSG
jgi:CubicO group peptidase (beta-lactamase class C family)